MATKIGAFKQVRRVKAYKYVNVVDSPSTKSNNENDQDDRCKYNGVSFSACGH